MDSEGSGVNPDASLFLVDGLDIAPVELRASTVPSRCAGTLHPLRVQPWYARNWSTLTSNTPDLGHTRCTPKTPDDIWRRSIVSGSLENAVHPNLESPREGRYMWATTPCALF